MPDHYSDEDLRSRVDVKPGVTNEKVCERFRITDFLLEIDVEETNQETESAFG
jgi:hypothetical protein